MLMPDEPAPDVNSNGSLATMRAHYPAHDENLGEFYLLNHFRAALPVDLRRVINLQLMPTLDLDTAVRLATIKLCSKEEAKSAPRVHAFQPEEEDEGVEAAIQNQAYRPKKFLQQNQQNQAPQNCQNFRPQNSYRGNQNQSSWRSNNPGNNSNKNKMTCTFCRKQGHWQEECWKRINANQPCLDSNGKAFWPKINTTDNGAPIQAFQDQDFQF
jgi:hypothetical protein